MNAPFLTQTSLATPEVNRVLRNTYGLLSLTLLFSAFMTVFAMNSGAHMPNMFVFLIVMIGFPFVLNMVRNSIWGIVLTFAYTGFFGWTLGPILNFYIHAFANGPQIVMMAAGGTGLIFLGLSAIAMNPKRDFSHWGAFLSMGAILCIIAVIVNLFLKLPAVQLAISVFASIVSGGFILYQTNAIVQGGERNYVTATVVLYVSIMNIFLTLLQVLSLFSGNNRN